MSRLPLLERAEALARNGDLARAVDLLRHEAGAGHAEAFHILARWALEGAFVRRDLALSRSLFMKAAQAGHPLAASIHRAFLAAGIGGPRDWRQALDLLRRAATGDQEVANQLDLIESMRLTDQGDPIDTPPGEVLAASPEARLFRSLFTAAECDFLSASSGPLFHPALVVDPRTGQQVPNPIRTSDGASFPVTLEGPAIHALNRRLAAASRTKPEQGEPLQVLRYRAGQEYRAHSDAIAGTDNQRVLTFLIYLNDDYAGGETEFIETGLKVKGRKGDGLLFRNADPAGKPDPLARHAGRPVTRGTKLIASRWIRARPLDLNRPLH